MADIFAALNFSPWTFLLQVVNLFVVMAFLYLIVYKPITTMVAEREQRIENSLEGAAKARKEAENMLAQYETQMRNSRQEAQEIIAQATRMAEEIKEQITSSARQEADKTIAKAKEQIKTETAKALGEIRDQAASLAVLAAGRVLERDLRPEDHERLVKEFIQEVGELQ